MNTTLPILQVLICTLGSDGLSRIAGLPHPEVPGVEYLVSVQNPGGRNEIEDFASKIPFYTRKDVSLHYCPTLGLSANRNNALLLSTSHYALISDDDLIYTEADLQKVIAAFKDNPEKAILTFRYKSENFPRIYPDHIFDLANPPKGYFVTSFEIALNMELIRQNNSKVFFNEHFGIGAEFGCGEEEIFIRDLLRAGHRGLFIPETIVEHPDNTTSMRQRLDKNFAETKGAMLSYLYPISWPLRMLTHTLRASKEGWKATDYIHYWLVGVQNLKKFTIEDETKISISDRQSWIAHIESRDEHSNQIQDNAEQPREIIPFFSIIVPIYNEEKWLREMLNSIELQTFNDWEVVIYDDASIDNSHAIYNEFRERWRSLYGSDKMRVYLRKENSGSDFEPRCMAISHSKGEYIVNIDADDTVEPTYLEKLYNRINDTQADIVMSSMQRLRTDNTTVPFITTENPTPEIAATVSPGYKLVKYTIDEWKVSAVGATKRTLALSNLIQFDQCMRQDKRFSVFDNENLSRLDLYNADKVAFSDAVYNYRKDFYHEASSQQDYSRYIQIIPSLLQLSSFIRRKYGDTSEEYALTHKMLFHRIFDCINLRMKYKGYRTDHQYDYFIRQGIKALEKKLIKPIVSKKYFMLMKLPLPMIETILRFYPHKS